MRAALAPGLLSSLLLFGHANAAAEVFEVTPADDLVAAIAGLEPGDELVLGAGDYTLAFSTIQVSGSDGLPITIRGRDGEVATITGDPLLQDTLRVAGAHLVFRNLTVASGATGIRLLPGASDVTIEDCRIHASAELGIAANSPGADYQRLVILRNEIDETGGGAGTGEGISLGCLADACSVSQSRIEGNYIHDTGGSQGEGIDVKAGSHDNVVRDNVIHDTLGTGISVLGTLGNGGVTVIERNAVWSTSDRGIQVVADAIVRNNIVFGTPLFGITALSVQAAPVENVSIVHNTVIAGDESEGGIRFSNLDPNVVIANNAVYARTTAIRTGTTAAVYVLAGNVGEGAVVGAGGDFDADGDLALDFVAANFAGTLPIDVFPAPGSLLVGAGDPVYATADDFNGTPRNGAADAGAYRFDANGNPGWTIAPGFKTVPEPGGGLLGFAAVATLAWRLSRRAP